MSSSDLNTTYPLPDAPAPTPRPVRQIPAWLSVLVVLACAAGGGWFVWTTFLSPAPRQKIVVMERGPKDGVRPEVDHWSIRSGNAWLGIPRSTTPAGGGSPDITFKFGNEFYPEDQRAVLKKVVTVVNSPAVAKSVGVTPEQMRQLQDIRKGAKITIDEADRARLAQLWTAYESEKDRQAKRAAETKLLKALEALAAKLEEPTLRSAAERAERAKSVLTAEQWKKLESYGR